MDLKLQQSTINNQQLLIKITGSKSETNRLFLLQGLYPNIVLENVSNSDDSEVMLQALQQATAIPLLGVRRLDIHHAGTAMRFLTAYFAQKVGSQFILTGSQRMQERPIAILVDALRQLGAQIEYINQEGFPPIKIVGTKITNNKVSLAANVSSQYISALLLIAPKLENGLELTLVGEITSVPYIKMTLALLTEIGIETTFSEKKISIKPTTHNPQLTTHNSQPTTITIESDWSSASYWYSIIALSPIGTSITLSSYKQNSLQGDSVLVEIYKDFSVLTVFNINNSITISKLEAHNSQPTTHNPQLKTQNPQLTTHNPQPTTHNQQPTTHNPQPTIHNPKPTTYNSQPTTHNFQPTTINLNNAPDIAQTIAVTCFGLGIGCHLTGLHTLKIKETDRLLALKTELTKLGATVSITDDSLTLETCYNILENVKINTYQDHRMAMAFAPLALKTNIIIQNAEVVSKSYPTFWEDLKEVGFDITQI